MVSIHHRYSRLDEWYGIVGMPPPRCVAGKDYIPYVVILIPRLIHEKNAPAKARQYDPLEDSTKHNSIVSRQQNCVAAESLLLQATIQATALIGI